MRKLIVLVLVTVLMAITNPDMSEFRTFVQTSITQEANQSGYSGLVNAAQGFKALTGFDSMGRLTDQVISNTKRDDYLVLSVYTVNPDGKRAQYLGIFKHFFVMNSQK